MNKPSPIIKYSLMGMACLGIFQTKQLTQYVDARIQELPVYGKQVQAATQEQPKKAQANPDLVKSLVPIYIESAAKNPSIDKPEQKSTALDSVFTPPVETKVNSGITKEMQEEIAKNEKKAKLETEHSFAYNLVVEATSKNTAVISGHAYSVGESVYSGAIKVGTLTKVEDTYVVVNTALKPVKIYIAN